jgi:Transposase DDE domain
MSKKKRYRVRNWKDYNKSLVNRGRITFWFDEKSIANWYENKQSKAKKRGRPRTYADIAIQCVLLIKVVFSLRLRSLQGFVESLVDLLKLPITVPDYTTISRRQKAIQVILERYKKGESLHVVVDSTGLKVFGEGEWKVRQHGYSKRRTWRKLHLGVDEASGEIVASALSTNDIGDSEVLPDLLQQIRDPIHQVSADGAYDTFGCHDAITERGANAVIPPRENARIAQHGNSNDPPLSRDEILRSIRDNGLKAWKQDSHYHRRSLAETAMYRFKQLLGRTLDARTFENQCTEAFIKCNAMNRMTSLGMPVSYAVEL